MLASPPRTTEPCAATGVDTGMHVMARNRWKVIAFFQTNATRTDQDILKEMDRRIGMPGQAGLQD